VVVVAGCVALVGFIFWSLVVPLVAGIVTDVILTGVVVVACVVVVVVGAGVVVGVGKVSMAVDKTTS